MTPADYLIRVILAEGKICPLVLTQAVPITDFKTHANPRIGSSFSDFYDRYILAEV